MRVSVKNLKVVLDEGLKSVGCPDDWESRAKWLREHEGEWVVDMWCFREAMVHLLEFEITELVGG